MRHAVRRLAAAVLVTAAAGLVLPVAGPAAPAAAATCQDAGGVTVVAEFRELGGGLQGACVPGGGGRSAADLFAAAGFTINANTPDNPGYVCQVSGKPAACTQPDDQAYWALYWSTGKGTWTYSNYGVSALKVPNGAWVGFAWKQGAGEATPPAVTPRTPSESAASPSPAPTSTPAPQPSPSSPPAQSGGQSGGPSGGQSGSQQGQQSGGQDEGGSPSESDESAPADPDASPGPTPGATTSASPRPARPTRSAGATPSASPTESGAPTPGAAAPGDEPTVGPVTEAVEPAASTTDGAGVPLWLAGLVVVLLIGIALVLARLRRGATPPEA